MVEKPLYLLYEAQRATVARESLQVHICFNDGTCSFNFCHQVLLITRKNTYTHTHSRTPVTIILRLSIIENNKLNEKNTLGVNRVYSVEMRNILKMAWDARNAHFFANGFTFRFILHFNLCQQENK